jgi:hypothetical protein
LPIFVFAIYNVYYGRGESDVYTSRTNIELLEENALLKQRIQELEKSEEGIKRTEESLPGCEREIHALFYQSFSLITILVLGGMLIYQNRTGKQFARVKELDCLDKHRRYTLADTSGRNTE